MRDQAAGIRRHRSGLQARCREGERSNARSSWRGLRDSYGGTGDPRGRYSRVTHNGHRHHQLATQCFPRPTSCGVPTGVGLKRRKVAQPAPSQRYARMSHRQPPPWWLLPAGSSNCVKVFFTTSRRCRSQYSVRAVLDGSPMYPIGGPTDIRWG